jgi:hypothetical protein
MDSLPGVVDAKIVRGARSKESSRSDLLIEIPHGATRTEDFDALARSLTSPLPPSLVDFFHVNTDAGAPELGEAVARRFCELRPERAAIVLRCRIPRTFIDCNRRIDASPEEFKAGRVTPGLMPWIVTPEDRALLVARYDGWVAASRTASEALASDGAVLMLHSYAPRTVDVEVDAKIVESLHRAYRPEIEPTFPLRPEIDVIGRGTDGKSFAPPQVMESLAKEMASIGITVADSATYPLHPSTLAWDHVVRRPGRAICIEVRRDLLADPFEPFAQMKIGEAKVARLCAPLSTAICQFWP